MAPRAECSETRQTSEAVLSPGGRGHVDADRGVRADGVPGVRV